MADHLTPFKRSWNMAQIRGADTSIEIQVRKALFHQGFRFRKNDKRLPGKPDIVLPKYRTVIFIHGCFWHRHAGCKYATTPSSNIEYWKNKFEKNVLNDERHQKDLENLGWNVITIWECEIKHNFSELMDRVETCIRDNIST